MQKVLLIDTNISSNPIYDFLYKSGYEVFVTGVKPSDFLAKTAKNYINIDYSNISEMRKLVQSLKIDFIIPGCNDLSYKISSQLNENNQFFGIDTPEITEIINSKGNFRDFATKINLPVPRVFSFNQSHNIFPLIVKPVDAYSGRGVTIVHEANQHLMSEAINLAKLFSSSKQYIIEEFIEGHLYSHSAFINDGKVIIDFIVEEHCTANPFVVDTSRVVYDFPNEMLSSIRNAISLMAKHLNLKDGLIHTQFIKRENSFWIIEVTRRCPGDLYSQLIELSTGFMYAEAYAIPFLNKNNGLNDKILDRHHLIRHTISQQEEKLLSSLKFHYPICLEKFIPISLVGDKIMASPFGRIAYLFMKFNSHEELLNLFEITLKRELYSIN